MKRLYIGLTGVCGLGVIASVAAVLWMLHLSTGVTFGKVANDILTSGYLTITGIAALVGLVAAAVLFLVRHKIVVLAATVVLWLASLTAIGAAAFQAEVLFARIAKVSKNMGGLELSIRAPGYADALFLLAVGLLAGALGFGVLAWLKVRARGVGRLA
jgi:hypothetical protein